MAMKVVKFIFICMNVLSVNYGDKKETIEWQPIRTGRNIALGSTHIGLTFAKILTNNLVLAYRVNLPKK
jgi:hypothetical protein